jgi:hypothetical protein
MKNFKGNFGVRANSEVLIKAFAQTAIELGWKQKPTTCGKGICLFFGSGKTEGTLSRGEFWQPTTVTAKPEEGIFIYDLPAQWDGAVKAASAEADAAVASGGEEEDPEEAGTPDPAELQKEADEKKKALKDAEEGSNLFTKFFDTIGTALSKTVNKYEEAVKGVVYALTGMASTPWHVTIGNPLRPIFCSGDMYTTTVQLTMGSTLAFNDLPANIKIDFTLENARPWGLQEIMAKFNTGNIRSVNVVKDVALLNPSEALSSNAYIYATQSGETPPGTQTPPGGGTPATNPPSSTNDATSKEGIGDTSVNSNPNSSDPVVEEPTTNNVVASLVGSVTYTDLANGGVRASATYLMNNTKEVSGVGEAPSNGSSKDVQKQTAAELSKQNAIKNYK